jgi:hypothetical protein
MKETDKIFLNTKSIQDLLAQLNEALLHLNETNKKIDARLQKFEALLAYQRELTASQTGIIIAHMVTGWIHFSFVWTVKQIKRLKLKIHKPEFKNVKPEAERGVSVPAKPDSSLKA